MSTLHTTQHTSGFTRSAVFATPSTAAKPATSLIDAMASHMHAALNALLQSYEARRRAQQEAYLAESTSMADLERRMFDMDRQESQPRLNMMTGMH